MLTASGDHYRVWATITGVNFNAPIGDVVKEKASFQVQGAPYFVANT